MLFLLRLLLVFFAVGSVQAADLTTAIGPDFNSYSLFALSVITLLSITLLIAYINLKVRYSKQRQQHKQLSSFLHHSTQLIAVLDQHMQPEFLNSHLIALSQQSTKTVTELTLALYADAHSLQTMASLLQQALHEQANWQGELWLDADTKNTKRRNLSVTITRLGDTQPIKYLFIGQDVSDEKQQLQLLLQQNIKDAETNLIAPAIFNEYIHNAILSCNEQHPKFAVMVIKTTYIMGIAEPDPQADFIKRLLLLANHISQHLPQGAILARYNNECLAVLLPAHLCSVNIDIRLNRLAHNILGLTDPKSAPEIAEQTYVGIAVFPDDGDSYSALLSNAAAALYNASQLGGSRFQFANTYMQQCSPEYFNLELELANAIARQQIEVYFQPKLSIASNKVIGYEALVRWHCPKRGTMLPSAFIHVADETGLIIKLDLLVFAKCCQQYINWQQHDINRGRIAINIASLSFQQTNFVSLLQQLLTQYQISAEHFALELAEDIFLNPNQALIEKLQQLVGLGFHLTLDNFGDGIASINVLRQFPLHSIKIAKSYIANMEHNEQQRNITASLIRLASYLHLDVIAMGIESEMQAYLLHVMGCDILQGHLFSKALPATEIPALLAKESKLIRKQVS